MVMSFHPAFDSTREVSGVPDFIFRHAPSPLTPGSRTTAHTRCFIVRDGLVLFDGLAAPTWCNEAELGSLIATARAFAAEAFASVTGASRVGSLQSHARPATWLTGHSTVNSFQFTRQNRFH